MFQRYFAYLITAYWSTYCLLINLLLTDQLIWRGVTFYVGGRIAAIKVETLDIGIVVQELRSAAQVLVKGLYICTNKSKF